MKLAICNCKILRIMRELYKTPPAATPPGLGFPKLHMNYSSFASFIRFVFVVFCFFSLVHTGSAQKTMDSVERGKLKLMLKNIKSEVEKNYYDDKFRGIDLEERFKRANDRLDAVSTSSQALGVIAQVLIDFNDSHLYFLPPPTNLDVEYGWRQRIIGNKSFITTVMPNSDASAKGLKPGDELLAIEGFAPSRKEMWKALYFYNVLSKRSSLRLKVQSPGESVPRELEIASRIRELPRVITEQTLFRVLDEDDSSPADYNYLKTVGNIAIWKMPTFSMSPNQIDLLVNKVKAVPNLVLDLRGNGGGLVESLERLAGLMFDKDLKIADLKGRKPMEPIASKTRGKDAYSGRLVVLMDSESGSAAEMFARIVQLEGRGKVVGDVSSGSVMQSRRQSMKLGTDSIVFYGASITNADVTMSDGKSLEHVGVIPDELTIPSGEDLAAGRDPALAKAIQLLGGVITPEIAGKMSRYVWKRSSTGADYVLLEMQ